MYFYFGVLLVVLTPIYAPFSRSFAQGTCTHPNDKKFRCVYFFSHEYFGIIINR